MDDAESAQVVFARYTSEFFEKCLAERNGCELQYALAMIKVADFYTELCRNPFVGLPKLTSDISLRIIKGISVMLPKVIKRLGHAQSIAMPTTQKSFHDARDSLVQSGDLLSLQRLVDGEKYGLTKCQVVAPDTVEVRIIAADQEALEHADRNALLDSEHADRVGMLHHIDTMALNTLQLRNSPGYAGSAQELVAWKEIGRQHLEFYVSEYAEADTFPDTSVIGPLTFQQWKRIAVDVCALGFAKAVLEIFELQRRGQFHVEGFMLQAPTCISAEELRDCFHVSDMADDPDLFEKISSCLILSKHNANGNYDTGEALPCLIRIGENVFMPRYARLANPYIFLVTRLAQVYQHQMRRISAEREGPFQDDLTRRLDPLHYLFGTHNVKLYRAKKIPLTDIDAVIYEKETNCLYLIQLKWFGLHVADLGRRDDQYNELQLKGTKWIDAVQGWVGRRSHTNVLQHVGLGDAGIDPASLKIRLIMLNRWWTRFSGTEAFDDRAAWLSWPRLCLLLRGTQASKAPLDHAWREAKQTQEQPHMPSGKRHKNLFPGFTVYLCE